MRCSSDNADVRISVSEAWSRIVKKELTSHSKYRELGMIGIPPVRWSELSAFLEIAGTSDFEPTCGRKMKSQRDGLAAGSGHRGLVARDAAVVRIHTRASGEGQESPFANTTRLKPEII